MKDMPYLRTMRDIKSAHSARISSIPKQQRSVHLDLYVLAGEKKRLDKELFQLQLKLKLVKKRLNQTNKYMAELIREISKSAAELGGKETGRGRLLAPLIKKMKISY